MKTDTNTNIDTTPGSALRHAQNKKIIKEEEECRKQGIIFLPPAADTLGGWHPVTMFLDLLISFYLIKPDM